jgi:peptidyl-prolyl cis-trans isomerase D
MSSIRNEETGVFRKIQDNTGCLIILLGLALLGFILTDALSNNAALFGGASQSSVGTINGEPITYEEYDAKYNEYVNNVMINNPGMEMNDAIREAYQNQAWRDLVDQRTTGMEYEKLGITVSKDELADVTYGSNPNQTLQQTFVDPETKQFSRELLVKFLQEDIMEDEAKYAQWKAFEDGMIRDMKTRKYADLLEMSTYATTLDAKEEVSILSQSASAVIVGLDYVAISDSGIDLTDADYRKYIEQNAAEFDQGPSRDFEYVTFDITPSPEDTAKALEWVEDRKESFAKATDDSVYMSLQNTESFYDPSFKPRGSFPDEAEEAIFIADTGEVIGPIYSGGRFVLYKVGAKGQDSMTSVRASHILVSAEGRTKADTLEAVAKGRQIIRKIRSGETTFEEEAKDNFDGSGDVGGDLGWIRGKDSYRMPKEFNRELFKHQNGDLFVVTTPRGIHVVKVTGGPTRATVQTTSIERSIQPGNKTTKRVFKNAGQFLAEADGTDDFEKLAESKGLTRKFAEKIDEETRQVPGMKEPNDLLRWLFNAETEEGDVSGVLEVDNKLVVARLTNIREEGLPEVEDVRDDIKEKVINMKKGEIIREKITSAMSDGISPDDLATKVGTYANKAPQVRFEEENVSYVGFAPEMVGAIFGTPKGSYTKPIETERGVYVAYVEGYNVTESPIPAEDVKTRLNSEMGREAVNKANEALQDKLEVKDQRYKYYN